MTYGNGETNVLVPAWYTLLVLFGNAIHMKKFMAIYMAPASVMEDWAKTDPEERKTLEAKMREEWMAWTEKNKAVLEVAPAGLGKTKRVSSDGVVDAKNELMMYSIVDAETPEDAAKIFEGHPHFGIPGATIEVMQINTIQ